MNFLAYKTLDAVNTTQGLHTVPVYINEITGGLFSRLFLFAFFIVMGVGSYLSRRRLTGQGDFPSSMAVAGFITSGAAIIMSFIPGLVNTFDIVVTFTATFAFVLWMFMSDNKEL